MAHENVAYTRQFILPRGNETLVLPAHPTQTHPLHNKLDLLLNTARSALSTILLVPGGTTTTFGNHPLSTRFVKGVFVSRPALSHYTEIWDIIHTSCV
jgi:hypothetical protein